MIRKAGQGGDARMAGVAVRGLQPGITVVLSPRPTARRLPALGMAVPGKMSSSDSFSISGAERRVARAMTGKTTSQLGAMIRRLAHLTRQAAHHPMPGSLNRRADPSWLKRGNRGGA